MQPTYRDVLSMAGEANIADDLIIYRNCVEAYDRRVYQAQTAYRRLTVNSVSFAYPSSLFSGTN